MYSIKSEEELKSDASAICKNLAPLIGCRYNSEKWSPKVGYKVCSYLNISGTQCSNVPSNKIVIGVPQISYEFSSVVTLGCNDIYRKVATFDKTILNDYYVAITPASAIPVEYSMSKKLQLAARVSAYSDSTIFDGIDGSALLSNKPIANLIYHTLLSCFTVRYFLMKYQSEGESLNTTEINKKVITQLVNNVKYIKYVLSEYSNSEVEFSFSANYISSQLSLLQKNLLMIQYFIIDYIE